jgi:hypothetical protein
MITTGKDATGFGKVGRRQVFFHRKVGESYNLKIVHLDNRKQTGASSEHGVYRIFREPILAELRNWSYLQIECERLCEFLNTERPGSHREILKETLGE